MRYRARRKRPRPRFRLFLFSSASRPQLTRWIVLLILLSPAIEVYTLVVAAQNFPRFTGAEVALAALVGFWLLRRGRAGFARAARDLRRRADSGGGFFSPAPFWRFGKLWLAGALLLIPGFFTDAIGAVVLLLPGGGDDGGGDSDSDAAPTAVYEVVADDPPRIGGESENRP